jgi:YVTN family beta-propeller protein
LHLTEQGSVTFVAWYTYDAAGEATWYVMSACNATTAGCAGEVYEVTGGTPLGTRWNPSGLVVTKVGDASISYAGNNDARFDYTLRGVTATRAITRQSVASGAAVAGSATGGSSGMWWNVEESGWGMTLAQEAGNVFAVVFTYDTRGKPTWYVASNCGIGFDNCAGPLYQTRGGRSPVTAWAGANVVASEVGRMNIAFSGNRLAQLRPTINGLAVDNVVTRMEFAPTLAAETTLGATLERPVFQCGAGTDTLNADQAPGSVTVFESGPVRPVAVSADGARVYVTNAVANCLEVYDTQGDSLKLISAVSVGLEPVAVAERHANEVWVVNHLSDSVSVVRLDGTPRVSHTLLVGDEPRDIVFAGPNKGRAFITAAARGQAKPGFSDSSLTTPGVGRADVWVFDATTLPAASSAAPLAIVNLFSDAPRALATNASGSVVYAAAFMSGNASTSLDATTVAGAKPTNAIRSAEGVLAPATALIVKRDAAGSAWRDETGRDWSANVRFTLPDFDVFAIDALASTPRTTGQVSGVGTTLFNMAVHPATGQLYVSNTEAQNHIRFEGSGRAGSTVRGRLAESRISAVNPSSAAVDAVHLNNHLDFSLAQGASLAASEKARSLSQPTALAFSPNGDTLYVAALGSAKVAVLPTAQLASARFSPDSNTHINVPAGPAGLALNSNGTRLYVYSHVAHQLSVIDTATRSVRASIALFSPESARVKQGRRVFYDATLSSANGTSSCASCHIFGHMDQLAWDLGNPDDTTTNNPNAYVTIAGFNLKTTFRFHPLKGPMTTQTLRGMAGNGPLHWRGDKSGTNRQLVRGTRETLEEAAFKEFNPAFVSLLGREAPLTDADMQAFTDFAMALALPPNPVRPLDNSLTPNQAAGRDIYLRRPTIVGGIATCNDCHRLNDANRQFGTSGLMSFEGGRIAENFKVPHLRNMYEKAGMFNTATSGAVTGGPQIRGFGFSNDGASDTLDTFFRDGVFSFPAPAATTRAQVVAYMMAFDTDLLPAVGQQVTWRPNADAATEARITLLKQQAFLANPRKACDLIVKSAREGSAYAGLYQADGTWLMRGGMVVRDAQLRQLGSAAEPLTYTCVVPGSGRRIALNAL